MGIFDRFKRSASKKRGKKPYRQVRGYEAAANKARYGDFRTSRGSADYELRRGLVKIRAKSRWLARNSSSMKRFLGLLKVNVIGENGFVFQSRVRKGDGELDTGLNERVEKDFKRWCKAPSVDGKMSMVELQNQRVNSLACDGEAIWEIVYNTKYTDGIAINPIEADYLDEDMNMIFPRNGNEIRMGIEMDRLGRPIAYHFLTNHPGDLTWYSYDMKRRYRRVPADRVLHTYERNRPGQSRGEPFLVTAINTIKMLDGYREAETVGRRVRAAIMGFVTSEKPTQQGIDELADDDYGDTEEGTTEPQLEMSIEPGMIKELPAGKTMKQFDPGGSQTDYAAYEGQIKTDIAQGAMISVFSQGMETKGISYSAGRLIVTEDRDYYKTLQQFLIRSDMEPLFKMWLMRRILQVEATIPPSRFDAIVDACKFRARGWDHVDPGKEIKANSQALADKQTSLTRVLAAKGIDVQDHFDEIVAEQKMAENRGLMLEYNNANSSPNSTTTGDVDDNEDEN